MNETNTRSRFDWRQALWFVALTVALGWAGLGSGIVGVRIPYVVTNDLHLGGGALARFNQIVALPTAFGLAYGLLRDRWPWGDRRLMLAALPVVVLGSLLPLMGGVSYGRLMGGAVVCAVAFGVVGAAVNGTMAAMGRRLQATDRLTAIWFAMNALVGALTQEVGGALSALPFGASVLFVALFGGALFLLVFRPPQDAFPAQEMEQTPSESVRRRLGRLVKSGPFLLAVLYSLLWNFSPAFLTPLQILLKDGLRLSEAQYAHFNSLGNLSLVPANLFFVWLSSRLPPRTILILGPMVVLPTEFSPLFVHSAGGAYAMAIVGGLASGTLNAAAFALLLRTVPRGLEGTGLALAGTLSVLLIGQGDVWATGLSARHGYAVTVWITAACTILAALVARFLPSFARDRLDNPGGTDGAVGAD